MSYKSDDGPAMYRRQITVEHRQSMARQECLDRLQIVVEKMLVIDLVESQVLDDLFHIEKLDYKNAVLLEAVPYAFRYRMQFLEMEEHTGSIDHIEVPV